MTRGRGIQRSGPRDPPGLVDGFSEGSRRRKFAKSWKSPPSLGEGHRPVWDSLRYRRSGLRRNVGKAPDAA